MWRAAHKRPRTGTGVARGSVQKIAGIEEGKPANFLVLDADSPFAAVSLALLDTEARDDGAVIERLWWLPSLASAKRDTI